MSGFKSLLVGLLVLIEYNKLATLATDVTQSDKPHIVFILADDAGWNDFSFHGSAQIPTPNIDALAYSGSVLNSYYGSPLCTPSRGSIFTGKYPIHLGLQHYVIRGDTADGLPLSEKLLPEYLKDLGYSTHLVGKWHLGHAWQVYTPTFRGFDTHFGYWLGSQDHYDHTSTDAGYWGYDLRNGTKVDRQHFGKYNAELFTDEAVRLIKRHPSDEPMFLMVTHTSPHVGNDYCPLQAPEENINKFNESILDVNRRAYAGMVDKLDESVGVIISTLADQGMLQNTIVIFVSDNGAAPEGFALSYGSNWPLRGVKNTLWEGGTRLAACIWSPTVLNRVSTDLMHTSDWLPTLYEAAGGNVSSLGLIDGVSLWQSLTTGEPSPRTQLLYNIDDIYNNSAVQSNSWKLIQGNVSTSDLGGGIWDGWYAFYQTNTTVDTIIPRILSSPTAAAFASVGYPLDQETTHNLQSDSQIQCSNASKTICDPYTKPCLFNTVEDPCEYVNLADDQPEIVQQLLSLIASYNKTARDVIDLSHNPEAAPHHWEYTWTNWKDFS